MIIAEKKLFKLAILMLTFVVGIALQIFLYCQTWSIHSRHGQVYRLHFSRGHCGSSRWWSHLFGLEP